MGTTRMLSYFAVAVLMAGCDPSAKANADERVVTSKDRLSQPYETCSATRDCAEGLRCFQDICRATETSVVGEYHAALGARVLGDGDVARAIEAYTAAVNRYESDRVPVPLDVLCGKGRALASASDDPDKAEQAARALHECLLGAPVGSAVRTQALAGLTRLGSLGLDPELLARQEPVSKYLTKQPAGPSSSKIKVSVTSDGRARGKSFTEFTELLASDAVRGQLLPCWEASYKATKQKTLAVTLGLKYFFFEGYDPSEDRDKLVIRSPEPAAGTPERCVHDVIGPMADEFSKSQRASGGRWEGNVTITLE